MDEKTPSQAFGENLRYLRKRFGTKNGRDFAKRLGIEGEGSIYYYYEQGHLPDLEMLIKIVDELNISQERTMRKTILLLVLLLAIVALIGCSTSESDPPYVPPYISFEEVSKPYLDTYGPPEDVNEFTSDCYHLIDWWWWSKGFEVSFLDSCYDETNGWTIDSTYSFSPIY